MKLQVDNLRDLPEIVLQLISVLVEEGVLRISDIERVASRTHLKVERSIYDRRSGT